MTIVDKLQAAKDKLKKVQADHNQVCKPLYKEIGKLQKQLIEEALTANKPKA